MFTSVSKNHKLGYANAKKVQRYIPEVTVRESEVDSEFSSVNKWDQVRLNNHLAAISEASALSPIPQDDMGVQKEVGQVLEAALKLNKNQRVQVNLSAFQCTQKARFFLFLLQSKIECGDLRLKVKSFSQVEEDENGNEIQRQYLTVENK